jgi:site-specific DNA-methyltransferase (adenine-specific)
MTTVSPDDLFAELSVAPAVSLNVSTLSPRATRKPIARGIGDVSVNLLHGDCLEVMRTLEDNSVDSVVTDPPYGLAALPSEVITETLIKWCSGERDYIPEGAGFMGKSWDCFVPPPAVWDEVYRVLKPGGHVVAFAGSRTQDLMGMSIRLAGFSIRENLAWVYGSGFPKSMDLSKAIDKAAGAEREVVGVNGSRPIQTSGRINAEASLDGSFEREENLITAPATPDAEYWQGWGTALKPAHEPIIMARKPLSENTVAQNVLLHGTGAINIDACRIAGVVPSVPMPAIPKGGHTSTHALGKIEGRSGEMSQPHAAGRFPANILLDRAAADELDKQSGNVKGAVSNGRKMNGAMFDVGEQLQTASYSDQGGASRFFMVADQDELDVPVPFHYSAKAPKAERPVVNGVAHVRWLVKLITPPGGTVLEPFAGSGTTVEAAIIEGFDVIAIEREDEYIPLIEERVNRQLRKSSAA